MLSRIKKILVLSFSLLIFGCSGGNDSGAPSQPKPEESKLEIQSLSLTPAQAIIPAGFSQEYRLDALLSDGQVIDITNETSVIWKISDATIAMPQIKDGMLHVAGLMPGTITISASITAHGATFSAKAQLEVTDAVMTALQVTPARHLLPIGLEQQYTAVVTMSDGHSYDVTNDTIVAWSSSDATVATISNDVATKGLATGIRAGTSTISATATVNGVKLTTHAQLEVSNAIMTALQVTPAMATTATGFEQQFTAIITMSDGHTYDVTDEAAIHWSSSDSDVVSISNTLADKGLAKGLKPGTSTITATVTANGVTFNAKAQLEVTDALMTALQVTPARHLLPIGLEQQYTAVVTMSDGHSYDVTNDTIVAWSSSDATVATISNDVATKGLATGIRAGTSTISATATVNGVKLTTHAQLEVSNAIMTALQVTPAMATTATGFEQQFTAIITMSDGHTYDVTDEAAIHWSSSDSDVVSISNTLADKGLAKGLKPGASTITATVTANEVTFNADAHLEVTNAIVTDLQITPTRGSIAVGLEQQFSARAIMSNGQVYDVTDEAAVNWHSSDTTVATIESKGLATAIQPGTTSITASVLIDGMTFNANASLDVTDAIITALEITPSNTSIAAGLDHPFLATAILSDGSRNDVTTDAAISWHSKNTSVATIDDVGLARGITPGSTSIVANLSVGRNIITAQADLVINDAIIMDLYIEPNKPNASLVSVGDIKQLSANVVMSDGTHYDVTKYSGLIWSSEDALVDVSPNGEQAGIVTGLSVGTAIIKASMTVDGIEFHASSIIGITEIPVLKRSNDLLTWNEAKSFCDDSNLVLLNRDELMTLYNDVTSYNNSTNENRFNDDMENIFGWKYGRYWSRTAFNSGAHYYVNMNAGYTSYSATDDNKGYATCTSPIAISAIILKPANSLGTSQKECSLLGSTKGSYRLPTDAELKKVVLYAELGNGNENVCNKYGWPLRGQCGGTSDFYWSEPLENNSVIAFDLNIGRFFNVGQPTESGNYYQTVCIKSD